MVRSLRILAPALLALSLPAGLAGCGNTGDLYLPPPPAAQTPEKAPKNPPQPAAPAADTPGSAGTTGGDAR